VKVDRSCLLKMLSLTNLFGYVLTKGNAFGNTEKNILLSNFNFISICRTRACNQLIKNQCLQYRTDGLERYALYDNVFMRFNVRPRDLSSTSTLYCQKSILTT